MEKITVQALGKEVDTPYQLAEKYYGMLSVLNNIHITEKELQLVAFTAVWGNITLVNAREEFCKTYKTTSPTINNMVSRLKKTGLLVKENGKVKVNPQLLINFKQPLTLVVKLTHIENEQDSK